MLQALVIVTAGQKEEDKKTNRQIDKHTNRQTDEQKNRQTDKAKMQLRLGWISNLIR